MHSAVCGVSGTDHSRSVAHPVLSHPAASGRLIRQCPPSAAHHHPDEQPEGQPDRGAARPDGDAAL